VNTFWVTRTRNQKLTGRVTVRPVQTKLGILKTGEAIALVVEETFERARYNVPPRSDDDLRWETYTAWRDATPLDLCSPALRWLIDGPTASQAKSVNRIVTAIEDAQD
jgi:hypothetical protein